MTVNTTRTTKYCKEKNENIKSKIISSKYFSSCESNSVGSRDIGDFSELLQSIGNVDSTNLDDGSVLQYNSTESLLL